MSLWILPPLPDEQTVQALYVAVVPCPSATLLSWKARLFLSSPSVTK